jgi:DUF1680 family protein
MTLLTSCVISRYSPMFKLILSGVLGLASGSIVLLHAQDANTVQRVDDSSPAFIDQENLVQAWPFDLSQVKVTGGVFKANQDLDEKYLLSLDPDRLLRNFRVNAKIPTDAKPLGGWESPDCGVRGHFVGHYLSACAEMYADTGDPRFRDRGTYIVAELGKCQDALGTGYLSAFPATAFDTLEKYYGGVWAPYYTIHKIMAGLLDQYHYCGNKQALKIAIKMADYFKARMAKLTPDQIDHELHTLGAGPQNEYGGMSEVLHNLYAITHRPEYLQFADLFDRSWFLNPLAMGQDELRGLHANTHIPQVTGFARHYELTGNVRYRLAAHYFWSQVTQHHSYVIGSNSKGEDFMAPDVEGNALGFDTGETCNVYNMLKLTQHIFSWNADVTAADYTELALYNDILGSMDPDTGMTTYFISLKPGHFKIYGTPETSFWCCTGTGIENHAKYGSAIYYHNRDTLWVNLFIPSRLTWPEKNLSLTQDTTFPKSDQTTLTITSPHPKAFRLLLRIPYWSRGASVKINGEQQSTPLSPDSYVSFDRTWKPGDKIELVLPMALHLHRATDNPNMAAIMYGPLVLAGVFGRNNMPPSDLTNNNYETFGGFPDPAVPSLTGSSDDLASWIKPVPGQALTFTTVNAGNPRDVTLKPFYSIHHERYSVYWQYSDLAHSASATP